MTCPTDYPATLPDVGTATCGEDDDATFPHRLRATADARASCDGRFVPMTGVVSARRRPLGILPDGTVVEMVELAAPNGVRAGIITLGAALQTFVTPDRRGVPADVTLGYDDAASYARGPNYWGQTIGRYANRIAGGAFEIDGEIHRTATNEGPNSLHGGLRGFDKAVWRITSVSSDGCARVVLALQSPAGDQGFPGTLEALVTYELNDCGALTIDFEASTDASTVVNMTNHAVFNLGGPGSGGIGDHVLTLPASRFVPVDRALIPTGELQSVDGGVFDFRGGRRLDDGLRAGCDPQIAIGRGWDHNWVLDKGRTVEPGLAARLEHPPSGRVLEVLTTEPGIQFYSGNHLDGTVVGKGGTLYRMGDGLALEPQLFPDTPNRPQFGSARVDPDRPYRHRMVYRVSATA